MRRYRKYVRKKNRRRERIKRILITIICIIILLLCVIAGVVFSSSDNEEKNATPDSTVASVTKNSEQIEETSKVTQETSLPEDYTYMQIIEESTKGLDEYNELYDMQTTSVLNDIGIDDSEFDFEQLVVVQSSETTAQIYSFEKVDGVWEYSNALDAVDGYVGSQGVSSQASEYVQHTPSGLYSLGTAFGICDNPGTKMDYFNVTDNSYWVDDPNSIYYNQHVEIQESEDIDWQSAEHLIDYNPAYNYAVVIEYNTNPIIPGNGSAFFIHVGYEPTAGCVSMPEESMIQLLCWLNPEKMPHVFIM